MIKGRVVIWINEPKTLVTMNRKNPKSHIFRFFWWLWACWLDIRWDLRCKVMPNDWTAEEITATAHPITVCGGSMMN